ncbi:LOW QUALITY PROTEIN: trichohyalin [Hypomesus transpacificus]|uniref:LOW QUALITY PROTEIN: trichohyalin n=1 Tax=Hypomesus transpacificus TaxID=137520 RepID=UPI001F075023|nr:LOW QUALITY PROTEIN: trichohyalin [Hypomesus transpacificus]
MDFKEARTELDQIAVRLQEDGLPPGASSEERQRHLWRQLREGDEALRSSQQEMLALRTQQASEMKEVENYVEHIRGLLEERESLTAEYERDNEQLRLDLEHIRLQQESQRKELEEMLIQEGLGEVGLSGPSEQVAYLLVERATLLERLESAERRLDTQSLTGSLREVHMQEELDQIRHTMEEELRQQREVAQKTRDTMSKRAGQSSWKKLFGLRRSPQSPHSAPLVHSEDLSRQCSDRQQLERDLDEASRRLAMAHLDIRRLTDELDAARKNHGMSGSELERTGQEVENLKKEVDKLKHCDMMEMQRAKEQNERLEEEIRVLRERVRSLDSEKRTLSEKVTREDLDSKAPGEKTPKELQDTPAEEQIHKRCVAAVEDARCQVRELQRRLQRQQEEQEELVERNEELEALLGETQNCSKEERLHQEGELEGLHRKIRSLEAELNKMAALDPAVRDGETSRETSRETETFTQQQTRASSQERASLLEARLTEEKDWRKQLEQDLNAAQAALKKDKEALQVGERELKNLRMEVQSLQTQCQQGKTLIKSLTQVKGEKGLLEEKVAQLERAQSRLREELERERGGGRPRQEQLQEGRAQADQLRGQLERVTSELSSLQEENRSLRDEMARERRQISDLQAQLSTLVQEKLQAQGERERLGLEAQVEMLGLETRGKRDRLGLDLQVSREQTTRAGQELETHSGQSASSLSLADKTKEDGLNQLSCLKLELSRVQATLQQERQLASQHQATLQAQITEAQARTKCQDSVLGQRTEEERQVKQDLQRAQSLFTSAERELRYEREKSLDLKKHNTLLEQEKLKLCAELRQTQARQAQAEQGSQGQAAETERLQQRLRELQLELARSGHSLTTNASLQEELQAERARVIAADKKVVELQQQLKTCQHQLRLEEARAGETSRLERDSRDMSDSLSALRGRQQEEQLHRKLLEQREEDLQQQLRSLRGKEASLGRSSTELGRRCQQLEARLAVLEAELSQARDEQRESQRTALRLGGELGASQQEGERLQEEIQQVITQLDTHIRKHNEKQSQHKIKLRKAKQIFLKATSQRDRTIHKLENDLALAFSLSQKEKDWIRTVMEENEKLLVERRDLLGRMSEAEELGSNGLRTASTVQHRVNMLEVENRQLQERTLKLSNQVGALERTLRNVQSFCSLEDVKKMYNSESLLNDSTLHTSTISLTSGACDPLGILDAICRMKASERVVGGTRTAFSVPSSQPSELGYLNLTSPSFPPEPKDPEDGLGVADEQV